MPLRAHLQFSFVTISCGLMVLTDAWTYHPSTNLMNWDKARQWCRTHYTDMVAIQNKEENAYLNDVLPGNPSYYWIGIRKINQIWTWVGTNKSLTKEAENWAPGEPNNLKNKQDCVEIYIKRKNHTGQWNDEPCRKGKIALCFLANCKSTPCNQHGDCIENIGNYNCDCHPGFYGPECQYVVNCETLSLLLNHTVANCTHPYGAFAYSSTCNFRCEEGFALKGSGDVRCYASGQWSAETPTCEATECRVLDSPVRGYATCSHHHQPFSYNSTCWFGCEEGFRLTGANRLYCAASGQWTAQPPTCEAVKCDILEPPSHGGINCLHLHGNFAYDSRCSFGCADGFALLGTEAVVCTASGNWSAPAPICEAIQCQHLDIPKQGNMKCSHPYGLFSYDSACDFSCELGFVLRGEKKIHCATNGNWTAATPECRAVSCGHLFTPAQGHMGCAHPFGEFSYNSTCTFNCIQGFLLMGLEKLSCDMYGNWSAGTRTCTAVNCSNLLAPAQGNMNCVHPYKEFSYNSTCDFICREGFHRIGPERLSCETSGTWSAPMTTCAAVKCSPLDRPTLGNMHCVHPFDEFAYTSACTFNCDHGFLLIGSERLSCGAYGNWSAGPPTCAAVKCGPLLAPSQGKVTCVHPFEQFSYNSTCDVICGEGFLLVGHEQLSCDASGEWSAPLPTCAAVKCSSLHEAMEQSMSCLHPFDEFSYNSTCTFSCGEGFLLMGSERLRCNVYGNWSAGAPRCEAVKCSSLHEAMEQSMSCLHPFDEFSYNSTCTFSCSEGFLLMGSERLRCNVYGNWSAGAPRCEARKCPVMEAPFRGLMNCSHLLGDFSYESSCEFSCESGFVRTSSKVLECTSFGKWTSQPPACQAVKCGPLPNPSQGDIRCVHPFDEFSYDSTCEFGCKEGFLLKGLKRLRCDASGNWSALTPTCTVVNCARLMSSEQRIMNCSHPNGNFSFQSSCDFDCAEGYSLTGPQRTQCQHSGLWSDTVPDCVANGPSFEKQVLTYSGGAAVTAAGLAMGGLLLITIMKRLRRKREDNMLLNAPRLTGIQPIKRMPLF
ncbi:P-selectin-like [Ambystoma mexicanum]|uniref:P-selectin-like n=1 Tax=Ambystoma mexicanum TaxID=8296 RepID=UPI0037E99CF7